MARKGCRDTGLTEGARRAPCRRRWWGRPPLDWQRLLGAAGGGLVLALVTIALARLTHTSWDILTDPAPSAQADFAWMYFALSTVWAHLWTGGSTAALYSVSAQRSWMTAHGVPYTALELYSYPPQFAVAFAWLGAFGYGAAGTVWTLLSFGWFVGAVAFGCELACPRRDWRVWTALAAVGLSCFPALTTFYWGQTDTLILFLVAAGLWSIHRGGRPLLGGACIALASVFKLTPAVLLVYFTARWVLGRMRDGGDAGPAGDAAARRRRAASDGWVAAGGLSMGLALTGLSVAAVGWGPFHSYLAQTLPEVQQIALAVGPAPMEQSLRGLLLLFLNPGFTVRVIADLLSLAAVVAVFVSDDRHPRADIRAEAAALALLPLLCSPSLEGHHFVAAVLPEVLLGGWLLEARVRRRVWALGLYAVAALLLAVPGEPFLPAVGRPLCSLPGQLGLLPGGGAIVVACAGQHLWSVLLLFGLALGGLLLPSGGPPRVGRRPQARTAVADPDRVCTQEQARSPASSISGWTWTHDTVPCTWRW